MYQKFLSLMCGNMVFLSFILLLFAVFSINTLHPIVAGDSVSYVESIEVLRHVDVPPDFIANRIVTTYGALQTIRLLDVFFQDISITWLVINTVLYICTGLFFYRIVDGLVEEKKIAFLSMWLLMTNYAMVRFGLGYLMDIGGWFFYIISIYFSYKYLQEERVRWLVAATSFVALGGLWKEYAFLAYVVVVGVIIYVNRSSLKKISVLLVSSGFAVATPIILINIYCFIVYKYTYLSWLAHQEGLYPGQNILVEYVKSFGSLYNFSSFFIIGGIVLFIKNIKSVFVDKKLFFIGLVIVSALPVFVWPVVTRVLFVTAPALILLSSLYMKKIERRWYVLYLVLILSALCGHYMDSFILNFVNLPF